MVYQTNHVNWSNIILWEDNNVLKYEKKVIGVS